MNREQVEKIVSDTEKSLAEAVAAGDIARSEELTEDIATLREWLTQEASGG